MATVRYLPAWEAGPVAMAVFMGLALVEKVPVAAVFLGVLLGFGAIGPVLAIAVASIAPVVAVVAIVAIVALGAGLVGDNGALHRRGGGVALAGLLLPEAHDGTVPRGARGMAQVPDPDQLNKARHGIAHRDR